MKDDSFILTLRWIIGGGAALTICYMIGIALGVTRVEAPAWVQAVASLSLRHIHEKEWRADFVMSMASELRLSMSTI